MGQSHRAVGYRKVSGEDRRWEPGKAADGDVPHRGCERDGKEAAAWGSLGPAAQL